MQLRSDVQIPDGLLAANVLLKEKPHQGVPSWKSALNQGIDERNSTAAIGLRAGLLLNRVESRYTGKERDTESGNDYFGARYYASSMGRMMSPDPIGIWVADKTNPQSWNLYSYVMNNPLKFTDPSGEECVWDDGSYDAADDKQTGSASGCSGQGGTYVPPSIFEGAEGNQYGSWSGQGSSQMQFDWLTPSATAFGGPNAAQQEVNDVVSGFFTGTSPQNIDYLPQDPFTLSFQKSAGMDAINAKIAANCPATSGKLAVGSGEAFVNTLIDGIAEVRDSILLRPNWEHLTLHTPVTVEQRR